MEKRENNSFIIAVLFFLLCFILGSHFQYNLDGDILIKQKQMTFGNIVDYGRESGRGGSSPEYKYKVHGVDYTGRFSRVNFCFKPRIGDKMKLSKIKIPIVYLPDKPRVSRIILNEEDYKKYDIPYPDTLPDILVKYFECESQ